MTVRVVIVDDQELVRAGFRTLVESDAGLEVVGEAGDGAEAVRMARESRPDVVLMDIRMPGVDGIRATQQITGDPDLGQVRVLVLTTFGEDEYIFGALRAGASGFLLKDTRPALLLEAIYTVAKGESLLAPQATRRLIEEYVSRPDPDRVLPESLAALTDRERAVLSLIARGRSNDEIARDLVISPLTAKTYVSRILSKLNARDRAQLVVIAYETGLVEPGG